MDRAVDIYIKFKRKFKKPEDRVEVLANVESYEVLWNSLHSALEADLSENGWPRNSKFLLGEAALTVETLINIAEGK